MKGTLAPRFQHLVVGMHHKFSWWLPLGDLRHCAHCLHMYKGPKLQPPNLQTGVSGLENHQGDNIDGLF